MNTSRTPLPHASRLSLHWQRAAMLGSLWAANEIVLGSFLHNVGLPFAGTVLACIGITLLVAGLRLWDDPGVIWRAGVICSLMKSISPSAVILGPMVGILAEAALLYLFVIAFHRSVVGCLLGGMLAAVTPILQKIISIVLAYGMDAARMYSSLFTLLSDRMQFQEVDAGGALLFLIAVQAIPGFLAAVAGIVIARGVIHTSPQHTTTAFDGGTEEVLFPALSQRYSRTALVVQILLIPAGLAFLPVLPPLLAPVPVAVYLFAVLFRYPSLRPKFKRPRLWIEFGAVALLAGVLLGVFAPEGTGTWWTGLQSGIVMTARATLVVAAFSAISFELRNPVVVNWFLQRGLGSVSAALQMAFRALPAMIQSLNRQRHNIRHPLRGLSQMVAAMLALLGEASGIRSQPKIYLLTGRQGEGKTTLLEKAVGQLRNQSVVVGGILAYMRREPGSTQSSGRIGYDIENILTGERAALCRTDHDEPGQAVGPFVFQQEGLSLGTKALAQDSLKTCAIVIVDEVGPLEMSGGGWAGAAQTLLHSDVTVVLLVVRPSLVEELQQTWRFVAEKVWHVSDANVAEIARELAVAAR